jgi:hypothetical protein
VEVTPISAYAVLIAKLESVTGVSATVTGITGFSTEVTAAAIQTAVELIDDAVHAEDTAHTTADKGMMILGVRNDSGAVMAGTTGDYIPFQMNENGLLGVNIDAIRDAAPDMNDGAASGATLRVVVAGTTETPTMAVYTDAQTIAAGKKSVTIITNATFTGTILTAAAEASSTYSWAASNNNTLGAIAVTCSAGGYTVLTSAI